MQFNSPEEVIEWADRVALKSIAGYIELGNDLNPYSTPSNRHSWQRGFDNAPPSAFEGSRDFDIHFQRGRAVGRYVEKYGMPEKTKEPRFALMDRVLVEVNTDPQRRCYHGAHAKRYRRRHPGNEEADMAKPEMRRRHPSQKQGQEMNDKTGKLLYLVITVSSLLSFVYLIQALQESKPPEVYEPEPEYSISQEEKNCLVESLYFESRGTDQQGRSNVADVILNRVKAKGFPDNVCAVIKEPKQFSYRNNFTPRKDWQEVVLRRGGKDAEALKEIQVLAEVKLKEGSADQDILWYTTPKVKRAWMKNLKVKFNDGWHKFFAKREA